MFASVWLGGADFQLVNLNCMLVNVMDVLRKRCNIEDEEVLLDLADEEGVMRCLPEFHPRLNTTRILKPRATYVPILIERDEENAVKPYEPYVTQLKENKDFMTALLTQYKKKERPCMGKKEKVTTGARGRGSNAVTTGAKASNSATKVKPKKGGSSSRTGKASR